MAGLTPLPTTHAHVSGVTWHWLRFSPSILTTERFESYHIFCNFWPEFVSKLNYLGNLKIVIKNKCGEKTRKVSAHLFQSSQNLKTIQQFTLHVMNKLQNFEHNFPSHLDFFANFI